MAKEKIKLNINGKPFEVKEDAVPSEPGVSNEVLIKKIEEMGKNNVFEREPEEIKKTGTEEDGAN